MNPFQIGMLALKEKLREDKLRVCHCAYAIDRAIEAQIKLMLYDPMFFEFMSKTNTRQVFYNKFKKKYLDGVIEDDDG